MMHNSFQYKQNQMKYYVIIHHWVLQCLVHVLLSLFTGVQLLQQSVNTSGSYPLLQQTFSCFVCYREHLSAGPLASGWSDCGQRLHHQIHAKQSLVGIYKNALPQSLCSSLAFILCFHNYIVIREIFVKILLSGRSLTNNKHLSN